MTSVSSMGVGAGMDLASIVSQLVAADRMAPDAQFKKKQSSTNAQISAFGAIKSNMTALQDALKKFGSDGAAVGRAATVSKDAPFTATASSSAPIGSFAITVDQIASAHKLQSAAANKDAQIGFGQLSIQAGDDAPILVDITEGSGRLSDIASAINAKAAGKGVTAAVVRGDAGDVLVLTAAKTGSAGALTVSSSGGDGGLAGFNTLGTLQAPNDAKVSIDGIARTSSSNQITDLVSGVTLDLTKADPGATHTLTLASDQAALKESLKAFVTAYNDTIGQISKQSLAGGVAGGVAMTAGALSGDSTARAMAAALRTQVSGSYSPLAELGFKTAVDGKLSLDETKLTEALAKNPDAVKSLLGEDGALGKGLSDAVKNYIGTDGMLNSRTKALNDKLKTIQKDVDAFNRRMEAAEANYKRQFSALDTLMGSMTSLQSYINSQFG